MWSSSPVCARPVRTLPRSALKAWTLLSIFCSVPFFSSAITLATSPPSYVNQSSFVLAEHHAAQRARLENAEDRDRQLLITAQRERGGVHHFQITRDCLVEADLGIALGARIAVRVGGVDPIHLSSLQHDLGTHLAAAQRGSGIRGEERIARAGREDHHFALLQVPDRLAADVRLAHLLDVERRLHATRDTRLTHRIGERERVHYRGEHAHVVRGGAVHAGGAGREPAENVSAADYHAELDSQT